MMWRLEYITQRHVIDYVVNSKTAYKQGLDLFQQKGTRVLLLNIIDDSGRRIYHYAEHADKQPTDDNV